MARSPFAGAVLGPGGRPLCDMLRRRAVGEIRRSQLPEIERAYQAAHRALGVTVPRDFCLSPISHVGIAEVISPFLGPAIY